MFSNLSLSDPTTWAVVLLPIAGALLVFAAGIVLGRFAQRAVRTWVPRLGGNSLTIAPLAGQAVRYAILIFSVITALGFLGVPQASILAVVGAASLAVALALQGTLSNIASGIMLAWIRPIAVGEYIKGDGVEGEVVEIGLFGTRLRSTSGLYVFTNNNRLWNGAITNHSREPRRRVDVNVTIPDHVDIGRIRKALLSIAAHDKRVLAEPAPVVIVEAFSNDSVSLQMRAWVPTREYLAGLRDLTESTKLGVNKILARTDSGTAEVSEAEDPHAAKSGALPPDLSADAT